MKEEIIGIKEESEENDFSSVDAEQAEEKTEPVCETEEVIVTKRLNKRLIITASVVFSVFLAVYISGVVYYSEHFYDNTTINGFPCSNMTVEEAEKSVIKGVENYKYIIFGRDNQKAEIKGKDVELKLETIGDLNEAKKRQSPWKWILPIKPRMQAVNIIVTLNEDLLYKKLQELDYIKTSKEAMKGAVSKMVYEDGVFKVKNKTEDKEKDLYSQMQESSFSKLSIEDKRKNIVSLSKLYECVKDGFYGLYPDMDLDREGCYISISEESNMKKALETMNKYVSTKVSYKKGDDVISLDGGSIHLWVSVDDKYNVFLDKEQVASFVKKLSAKYNTVGMERDFKTSNDKKIKISGGDYGWKLNVKDETEALCEIIKKGETVEREPIFSQRAEAMGASDIDNTYVEISIKEQHLWFYKNGEVIVSTDVVTGNPYAGNATPTGVYRLKYKDRDAVLVGADYRTPVEYWMPFNGGVGMHDANWRGSFGGEIYLGGGSHGCINLPPSIAGKIFSNIEAGNVVIVY